MDSEERPRDVRNIIGNGTIFISHICKNTQLETLKRKINQINQWMHLQLSLGAEHFSRIHCSTLFGIGRCE